MKHREARRVVVAYDVPDDARRLRISRALSEFGDRVQYSVFVVDATPAGLGRMSRRVESLMDAEADSVLLCDLGPLRSVESSRFRYLGCKRPITSDDDFVV